MKDTLQLAITEQELGRRLKAARENADLTQSRVAEQMEFARTTLVAIEKGERHVRAPELLRLADIYSTSVNRLLRPDAIHEEISPSFRREIRAVPRRAQAAQEAVKLLANLSTAYAEVEALLGRRRSFVLPPPRPVPSRRLDEAANDLAQEIRDRLNFRLGPVTALPQALEREWGFRIFLHPVDSSVSGVFAFTESLGPNVLLNRKHPISRTNWTLAHELGHFLTDRDGANVVLLDQHLIEPSERFVDKFAAAFLMPASALRRQFNEISEGGESFSARNLIFLAHEFQVSLQAMTLRLTDLGLLRKGTYEALKERGLGDETVDRVLEDTPLASWQYVPKLHLLVFEALDRELISEGQASDLLALDRTEVRELGEELGGNIRLDLGAS